MPSFLVLCPFVHRPSFEQMMETLHPDLVADALVIDNTETNLGAAGSCNVGARRMLATGVDWLVDISPVARFGPPGGSDFIEALDRFADQWIVQSASPVNWHCMAWSRTMFETVGLFDENFWPVYGEDGDISYRVHTAVRERDDPRFCAWECFETDAWVTMYGHSRRLAGIEPDMARIWAYYKTKWGGLSGQEAFTHPFDDASLPLSFWPEPPDKRCSGLRP